MTTVAPRVGSVVINCNDIETVVSFWKELLGKNETQRFPGFVWLERMGDGGPALAFQQVPETKTGRNRLHIDLSTKDREALIARVESLGGSRIEDHEIQGFHWTVMGDPEGNEFCIAGE
jgi:predicted enzyme related to lactoylglutathione lyase